MDIALVLHASFMFRCKPNNYISIHVLINPSIHILIHTYTHPSIAPWTIESAYIYIDQYNIHLCVATSSNTITTEHCFNKFMMYACINHILYNISFPLVYHRSLFNFECSKVNIFRSINIYKYGQEQYIDYMFTVQT